MPRYTFVLRDGSDVICDDDGVVLENGRDAFEYACGVARELMTNRKKQTRVWRLDVYEDGNDLLYQIPFATIDWSLDHLHFDLRSTVEIFCQRQLALKEAVSAARVTLRESRALVARAQGKPYLATRFGERTIR